MHLPKLLDAVGAGKRVVITRHGKPAAELLAPTPVKRPKLGCAKGPGFYMAPDFDEPLECFKEYM